MYAEILGKMASALGGVIQENWIKLMPLVIAFLVTAVLGPVLIPWLHKLKFGQQILEDGPKWHQKIRYTYDGRPYVYCRRDSSDHRGVGHTL